MKMLLRYVKRIIDRYGNPRFYLRRAGHKLIPLPSPDNPDFYLAYSNALTATTDKKPETTSAPKPKNLIHLIEIWQRSPQFLALAASTKRDYISLLTEIQTADYAVALVVHFNSSHIYQIIERDASKPAKANKKLNLFKNLFNYAVKLNWRNDNPAATVARLPVRNQGVRSWTDAEIDQYLDYWPAGTPQRLALVLMLYTSQRRSDIVRLGWGNVQGNYLVFVPQKTQKTGKQLEIRIHPNLRAELEHTDRAAPTFILSEWGMPFSRNGFYRRFKQYRREAGLPEGLSPHGLRKACARRLAEAGCTPHQIAAVTGHATLAEIERYTKQASQRRLADEAVDRI